MGMQRIGTIGVLALMAACGTPAELEQPSLLAMEAAATPVDFTLFASPMVAGEQARLFVRGAPANRYVSFVTGTEGLGMGLCPSALEGRCLHVAGTPSVLALSAFTDDAGDAVLEVPVPRENALQYVAFQAIISGPEASISNAIGSYVAAPGSPVNGYGDRDRDGYSPAEGDCDDFNASFYPGAADTFGDGFDSNCDHMDGVDADADGAASLASGGADCDDMDSAVRPGALESCNKVDDNCDGMVDFDQLGDMCDQVEVFDIDKPRDADILFVVDATPGMTNTQDRLANAVARLVEPAAMSGVRAHFGVISAEASDPATAGFLVPAMGGMYATNAFRGPGEISSFLSEAIRNVGTAGTGNMALRSALFAMTPDRLFGFNDGFYRHRADLHLVFVSDGDDESQGDPSDKDFIVGAQGMKMLDYQVFAHIIAPGPACRNLHTPAIFDAVTDDLKGERASSCIPDAGRLLSRVGDRIGGAVVAEREFAVQGSPDLATLQVEVVSADGTVTVVPSAMWTADARGVEIDQSYPMPTNAVLQVRYDVAPR